MCEDRQLSVLRTPTPCCHPESPGAPSIGTNSYFKPKKLQAMDGNSHPSHGFLNPIQSPFSTSLSCLKASLEARLAVSRGHILWIADIFISFWSLYYAISAKF